MAVKTKRTERRFELSTCEGFRVQSPDGRVGDVELALPGRLIVRVGLFRPRRLAIPLSEVERVSPRERRVSLRAHPPMDVPCGWE
jgi:hypothetical protein